MKPDVKLWLDANRGIYIPQHFAQSFANPDACVTGLCATDWAALLHGPDHEWYWEAWQNVLNNAIVTDEHGVRHSVYQDGDCWLVPVGMIQETEEGAWSWPEEAGNLSEDPQEWLAQQFEFAWCPECGRDHRHHTAVPLAGNWFARCDLAPVYEGAELVINPEKYPDGKSNRLSSGS